MDEKSALDELVQQDGGPCGRQVPQTRGLRQRQRQPGHFEEFRADVLQQRARPRRPWSVSIRALDRRPRCGDHHDLPSIAFRTAAVPFRSVHGSIIDRAEQRVVALAQRSA
jgi:hypothetical protein